MKEMMKELEKVGVEVKDWKELSDKGFVFVECVYGYESEKSFEKVLESMVEEIVKHGKELDFEEDEDIDLEEKKVYYGFY